MTPTEINAELKSRFIFSYDLPRNTTFIRIILNNKNNESLVRKWFHLCVVSKLRKMTMGNGGEFCP